MCVDSAGPGRLGSVTMPSSITWLSSISRRSPTTSALGPPRVPLCGASTIATLLSRTSPAISRALTRQLAAAGAKVAASDIDEAGLQETVALAGGQTRGYKLDVGDRDAIYAHADEVLKDFGRADLLINNAGVALKGTVREMTDDDLKWVMD